MKRVYTKTGDKGTTGIHGGARVPKDDIRIEANGCLDELNAVIGIVRSMLAAKDAWQELLHAVQRELMVVMSHVATPSGLRDADPERPGSGNPNELHAVEMTVRCEQAMDAMMLQLEDNDYFLLPGGTQISAQLQFARAVADRILFFDQGVIEEEGTPSELFDHPKRERTKQFLHSFRYERSQ